MFCTAYITAYYLKHVLQLSGKVYLMGMPGFAHELDLLGVAYTGTGVGQGCGCDLHYDRSGSGLWV